MRYKHFKTYVFFSAIIVLLLAAACSKEWDDHYDSGSFDLPDKTLTELIKNQPDLSTF